MRWIHITKYEILFKMFDTLKKAFIYFEQKYERIGIGIMYFQKILSKGSLFFVIIPFIQW